jgi:hypothetical protein
MACSLPRRCLYCDQNCCVDRPDSCPLARRQRRRFRGGPATAIALSQELEKQENLMRSKWIEYKGKRIFYQDFSKLHYNSAAVKAELAEAQQIVTGQPLGSVLVLSDFRDTNVGSNLLPSMNAASAATKAYVRRTAVLGVSGIKRKLADILTALTGQPLKYFDDLESAQHWLAAE